MRRRAAGLTTVALIAIALAGCAGADTSSEGVADPSGIHEEDFDRPSTDDVDGMPPECAVVGVGWYPGIDIANVETMPADWPEAPEGATLCSTLSGGSVQTAVYASDWGTDAIFEYYGDSLPAGYTATQASGADNGTGYATLEGNGPGVAFQVRENDGGFTLAFANEAD